MLKNGAYTVKVRITNYRNVEYINTKLTSLENHWNALLGLPTRAHPEFRKLFKRIEDIKESVEFELKLAKRNHELLSMAELKQRVEQKDQVEISQGAKKASRIL